MEGSTHIHSGGVLERKKKKKIEKGRRRRLGEKKKEKKKKRKKGAHVSVFLLSSFSVDQVAFQELQAGIIQ